ncbi:MAG: transposase [Verrucomicrobiota bacterium]
MNPHLPEPTKEAFKLSRELRSGENTAPKWRWRGQLPHYENSKLLQAITFRLADSIPSQKIEILKQDLANLPTQKRSHETRRRLGKWLDQGHGSCALQHPKVASTLKNSLYRFDGDRYELIEWVIMPNHVHVLIQPHTQLSKIVQSWKSYVASWTLGRWEKLELPTPQPTHLWMPDYWDRFIRDQEHLRLAIDYIRSNPSKAGLSNWPWQGGRSAKHQLRNNDINKNT